jgi:hypothetical protein
MTQTHVLAAHLDTHGDLIADPDTPSEHLIATFTVEAFESLWEDRGWVLVDRNGEAVDSIEKADPDAQDDGTAGPVDRAALRKEQAKKFSRSSKRSAGTSSTTSASRSGSTSSTEG